MVICFAVNVQATKALNEVWRQYEMKQKPACVLNFLLPLGEYDVNVTPDKRETFIKHEAEIIEAFKIQLNKLYEPTRGAFTVQPLLSSFTRVSKKSEDRNDESKPSPASRLRSSSSTELQETISSPALQDEEPMDNDPRFQGQISTIRPQSVADTNSGGGGVSYHGVSPEKVHAVIVEVLSPKRRHPSTDVSSNNATEHHQPAQISTAENHSTDSFAGCCSSSSPHHSNGTHGVPESPVIQEIVQQPRAKKQKVYRDDKDSGLRSEIFRDSMQASEWSFSEMKKQRKQFFAEEVEDELERRKRMNRLKVPKTCSAGGDDTENGTSSSLEVDNEVAAAALQRVLKKDDFKRMQVLGQFNLGFIIGKLDDDMFIIDQHASDEKFNYETLQQTTVLHQQPLVRPLPLELTAGEEMVVMDHLDVFAKNGFTFLVNKEAAPTKKLKLLSLPFTKQTQFGIEDIRELASLLMDAPMNASSIRLPKIMAMFASRACRSSIMIGTALHKEEMQKIVRNLSGLEQPWNCPHGYMLSAIQALVTHTDGI